MQPSQSISCRALLALAVLLTAASLVIADSSSKPPAPKFPKRAGSQAEPARATPRAAHAPTAIVPPRPASSAARTRPGTVQQVPGDPGLPPEAEIEAHGLEAGAALADALAGSEGRVGAYRIGVWQGQNEALADSVPDRWAYEDGLRGGRWDPEARAFGASLGSADAAQRAALDAQQQVEAQFHDLDRKPARAPRLAPGVYQPQIAATPAPDLDNLYAELPPARVPGIPGRFAAAFAGWSYGPEQLRGCSSWSEFSNRDWQDPERAFHRFQDDPRRSAYYRRLPGPRARDLFAAAFVDGFLDRLPATYDRVLDPAFGEGYADGWAYGAYVHAEWSFRRGYAEGFDDAVALAAQVAFERTYAAEYDRVYYESFDEWMRTPRPAILSARLVDGNDDGVFEPGESLAVEVDLANYGGASGTFPLALAGAVLQDGADASIVLPARRRLAPRATLRATVAQSAATPSTAKIVLRLGAEHSDLPLLVSYPLEFTGNAAYESLPLEGRGHVRFEVVNRSRRTVESVEVVRETINGSAAAQTQQLGDVAPGATAEAEFVVEGMQALDLIAGDVRVVAAVHARGKLQGRQTARFPELATRLDDPALVEYLVRLGSDADPDLHAVQAARRLLMQRLEADWRMRCDEDGNSYQADMSTGSTHTALGELVAAYGRDRRTLSRSVAFHGLDDEIRALAEELPGVHPNLRRSMKKLAARIES